VRVCLCVSVHLLFTLAGYGMKIPVPDMLKVDAVKSVGFCRYDIDHNVDLPNIPIVMSNKGPCSGISLGQRA